MTGHAYADLIAAYIVEIFGGRGIVVYREIRIGTTVIGKKRQMDILVLEQSTNTAFAIECKYQDVPGTVDEKIPYAIEDMKALPMKGCIAYGGDGFSPGVLQMLRGSDIAAWCMPDPSALRRSKVTLELDHFLAMYFGWWDVIVGTKEPLSARYTCGR